SNLPIFGLALGGRADWTLYRVDSRAERPIGLETAVGFLAGFCVLGALSPKKLEFNTIVLVAMAAIGTVNMIAFSDLLALPLILACALVGCLLLVYLARRPNSVGWRWIGDGEA